MKVLSIDPGAKRIGLARAETELGIAFPFKLLTPQNMTDARNQITDIVESEDIQHVLLGWPLGLDSRETEQTAAVRSLYNLLSETLRVSLERVDERLSTRRATQNVGDTGDVDVEAARVLLEEWLRNQHMI
jgi:putative transcription antitermination factor YqgF